MAVSFFVPHKLAAMLLISLWLVVWVKKVDFKVVCILTYNVASREPWEGGVMMEKCQHTGYLHNLVIRETIESLVFSFVAM